jgi:D-tyrosyl-tRNA(Tyr) deacylase
MKAVIQRVSSASVAIDSKIVGSINSGLVVLLGIADNDDQNDIEWLANKIINLRIFKDANDLMNLNLADSDGEILLISQFTLHAKTKKGNRPSFIHAAKPAIAIPLYERFIEHLNKTCSKPVQTGQFGADMQVTLVNDGPVTIVIDSKNKE